MNFPYTHKQQFDEYAIYTYKQNVSLWFFRIYGEHLRVQPCGCAMNGTQYK